MADHSSLIDEFVSITGVDEERAEFYLSSAGWRLQVALSSFFEHRDEDDDEHLPVAATAGAALSGSRPGHSAAPLPPSAASAAEGRSPSSKQPVASANSRRIATLASVQQQRHGHQHSSDSEGEEGQAYYAGGSEESGQQIIGPSKKKNQKPTEVIESLFKSAKDHGAEVVEPDDASRSSMHRKQMQGSLFAGAGYKLGESEAEPSVMVPSTSRGPQAKKVDCVLRLWKTGFTVDDGPLREFSKPENAEFLSAISKGEVPKELIRQARGSEVSLNMEDRRTEDYVPPKVQMKAFTGQGQMLGSPAPQVIVSTATRGAAAAPAAPASSPADLRAAGGVQVDETQPTTSLQIRLADGTRLTAKFNLSHTVDDVRRYVRLSKLQYASASFVLLTTFPNKELTDGAATLKDANLHNAVIVQKMI